MQEIDENYEDHSVIKIKRLGVKPIKRQVHTSKPKRRKPNALTTEALHPSIPAQPPVASETMPKGRAIEMIESAGFDAREFEKVLGVWVTSGVVEKEGRQYLIPKVYVDKYIKKLEADRG